MQLDEGNINILYAGSVRKTYAKTTQQFFKVLHGIPWKHIWLFEVQQSQGLLSGTYLYIYMWQCGIAIVIAISIYIYIYLKHIYIVSRGKKRLPRLPTCHCHGAQRPCWSPTSVEHLRWCHSHSSDSTVYNEISSLKGLKWIFTILFHLI